MTYCDDHCCSCCPAALPGGLCWEPSAEELGEMEYWDTRMAEEAEAREMMGY